MDAAPKKSLKPTPQISPNHCATCGQLIGSKHCECDLQRLADEEQQRADDEIARLEAGDERDWEAHDDDHMGYDTTAEKEMDR